MSAHIKKLQSVFKQPSEHYDQNADDIELPVLARMKENALLKVRVKMWMHLNYHLQSYINRPSITH